MPIKVQDDAGNEIEAFTKEELSVQVEEAKKSAESATLAKASEEKSALEQKLREIHEAGESQNKEEQVKRLREKLEAKDAEMKSIKEANASTDAKVEEVKKSLTDKLKNSYLEQAARGDKELAKRIQHEFDNYRPHDNSEDGIKERMEKATILAGGDAPRPGAFDGGFGMSARGSGFTAQSPSAGVSANEAAIGQVLGVTDADRKAVADFKKSRGIV
jgi:hypothetical protein